MKLRYMLLITIIGFLLSLTAYSRPELNKENIKPPTSPPPNTKPLKLKEYKYISSGDSKKYFSILYPSEWVIQSKADKNIEAVSFLKPLKQKNPDTGLIVTIETISEIKDPLAYLSGNPVFKGAILVPESLKLFYENKNIKVWTSLWKKTEMEKIGNKNVAIEFLMPNILVLNNDVYSLTGWGVKKVNNLENKEIDRFLETFKLVAESFKPGGLENIALQQTPVSQPTQVSLETPVPQPTQVSLQTPIQVGETTEPVFKILKPLELEKAKNLTIEYKGSEINVLGLADDESGIARILINKKEALLNPVSQENMKYAEGMKKPVEFSQNILLALGENNIEIIAVDINGNQSKPKLYTLKRSNEALATTTEPGKQWAVVIGVGKYQNPKINPLKYTSSDAKSVYDYLIKKGGFLPDHVKLLLDQEATTKNVRAALGEFLSKKAATKDDMVFIYFSGHGAPEFDSASPDGDGISKYIITYDTDPDSLYSTAFPMSEIATIFGRIKAEKIVFFIDSCYSGASGGKTFAGESGGKSMTITDGFLAKLSGKGRLIITASDTNEVSLEKDELGHGIFTYYMLEALQGKSDINKDGLITVDEVYSYLFDKVARASDSRQHPVKKGESSGQIVIGVWDKK